MPKSEDNIKSDLLQKYSAMMWTVPHGTQNRVKWRDFLKKVVKRLDTSRAREVFGWMSDCQRVKVRVLHGQSDTI